MATFVKLTNVYRQSPEWVNLDLVKTITREPAVNSDYQGRAPERTALWFSGYGGDKEEVCVAETPEEIVRLADPESDCPDPGVCTYREYLGQRGDGSDLTHGGYHAAREAAARHISTCTVTERTNRICETCIDHERRIRA